MWIHSFVSWGCAYRTRQHSRHGVIHMTLNCVHCTHNCVMLDWELHQLLSWRDYVLQCFQLFCLVVRFGGLMRFTKFWSKVNLRFNVHTLLLYYNMWKSGLVFLLQLRMRMYISCWACPPFFHWYLSACRSCGYRCRLFSGPLLLK